MSRVLNRYKDALTITKHDVYIGRGSSWGNPFKIGVDGNRDEVCDKFYTYFADRVNNDFPPFMRELERLMNIWLDTGELRLQCFCKPKR